MVSVSLACAEGYPLMDLSPAVPTHPAVSRSEFPQRLKLWERGPGPSKWMAKSGGQGRGDGHGRKRRWGAGYLALRAHGPPRPFVYVQESTCRVIGHELKS